MHEWWGLNDNIRAMAERLAGEGYAALAVDLYGGVSAVAPQEARDLMQEAMANRPAAEADLREAHAYLREELGATQVGSIGWCFGGAWSLSIALMYPDTLDAAVIYYGRLVTDQAALAPLEVPLSASLAPRTAGFRFRVCEPSRRPSPHWARTRRLSFTTTPTMLSPIRRGNATTQSPPPMPGGVPRRSWPATWSRLRHGLADPYVETDAHPVACAAVRAYPVFQPGRKYVHSARFCSRGRPRWR